MLLKSLKKNWYNLNKKKWFQFIVLIISLVGTYYIFTSYSGAPRIIFLIPVVSGGIKALLLLLNISEIVSKKE